MKLTIRKLGIMEIVLFLVVFLDSIALYIIPKQDFLLKLNSSYNKYVIVMLGILLFIIYNNRLKIFARNNSKMLSLIIGMLISIAIVAFYSILIYPQGVFDVFTRCYYYLILLLSLPVYYFVFKKNGEKYLTTLIINVGVLFCILLIIQAVVYNNNHSIFLPGIYEDVYSFRNGRIRFSVSSIVSLALVFCSANFFLENRIRKKILCLIKMAIIIFASFYVFESRALLVMYALLIIVSYLSTSEKKNNIRRWYLVVIVLIVVMQTEHFTSFMESFSVESIRGTGLSTATRINAILYYWECIKKNPLFGIGFIGNSVVELQTISKGPYLVYYYSDLGLYGLLAETGIVGALPFILITIQLIKKALISYKLNIVDQSSKFSKSYLIGLVAFWVLSSFTMCLTNSRNSLMMPFIIGLVCSMYDNIMRKQRG